MTTDEMLSKILEKIEGLEQGQKALEEGQNNLWAEVRGLKKDVVTIKHDVKEISWKVDTLYDWADRIDLKVKAIDDRTA